MKNNSRQIVNKKRISIISGELYLKIYGISKKLSLVIIILCCIPIQFTQTATLTAILYSHATDVPIIDGEFEEDIWKTRRDVDIALVNFEDQTDYFRISIMSVYNIENNSIVFGFTIPDTTAESGLLTLVFKTNTSSELLSYTEKWGWGYGNDVNYFYPYNATSYDCYSEPAPEDYEVLFGAQTDPIDNIYGKAKHIDSKSYQIELAMPLDSGDIIGCDFNLARLDTIDFFVWYSDEKGMYTNILSDFDFVYITLNVGGQNGLDLNNMFVFVCSISSLFLIRIIIQRKKK